MSVVSYQYMKGRYGCLCLKYKHFRHCCDFRVYFEGKWHEILLLSLYFIRSLLLNIKKFFGQIKSN